MSKEWTEQNKADLKALSNCPHALTQSQRKRLMELQEKKQNAPGYRRLGYVAPDDFETKE